MEFNTIDYRHSCNSMYWVFYVYNYTVFTYNNGVIYAEGHQIKTAVDKYSKVRTKLTLILLKDDKVFGYYGDFIKGGRSISISETDKLIEDGWKMFSKDSLVVVIKPSEKASYKATVDILDQMTINHIEKYSMIDLNKEEKEFLK